MSVERGSLRALVVDDEVPARNELAFLLDRDERVGAVATAGDAAEALRVLQDDPVDVVFLDIRMPGLDGMELAGVLRRFADPPAVVFVTAYDAHAVEAFDLRAVDYLLKPVRDERLAQAVGRVLDARASAPPAEVPPTEAPPTEAPPTEAPPAEAPAGGAPGPVVGPTATAVPVAPPPERAEDETIPVELGGVTRFVRRSDVRYVEAHGDYARLVTGSGRHLVRVPLSLLEERWGAAGFARIHRRWLVNLASIDEVRIDGGRMSVRVGDDLLEVSRRHTKEVRDRLVRHARPRR